MLRIRTFSLGVAAFLLGAGPAMAADPYGNPYDSSAMLAAPAGFTWTGPYLGAIVGYGWNGFTGTSGPLDGRSNNAQGGKIGLYGGYNVELGNGVVLGGEADLSTDGVNGSKAVWGTASQKWDATARARAGYSFGRLMAYGTGGAAITGASVDNGFFDSSANHLGWVLGGGLEGALTDHVTARLEYQYESFGSQLYRTGLASSSDVELNSSTVRAGIGYKF